MVSTMIAAAFESNSADAKSLIADACKSKVEMKEATKKLVLQIDEAKESCAWCGMMCLAKFEMWWVWHIDIMVGFA